MSLVAAILYVTNLRIIVLMIIQYNNAQCALNKLTCGQLRPLLNGVTLFSKIQFSSVQFI